MDCKDYEDLISAYADGETTGEETARVEAHLRACLACKRELAVIRRSKGILASMPVPETPADLKAALRVAAAQAEARSRAEPERPLPPSESCRRQGARSRATLSGPSLLDRFLGVFTPRYGLAFGLAVFLLVGLWFGAMQDEAVPLDVMLSAHRQYVEAQPLARADAQPAGALPDEAEEDETDD